MKGPGYVPGVPTPFTMHVNPYPTRFHGGIWSRPAFKFPQIQQTSTVFLPPRDIDMIPDRPPNGYSGLGGGDLAVDAGDGIFRPGGYGGGVFDGNLAGAPSLGRARTLGDASTDTGDYPWMAYSAKTAALQTATNASLAAAGYCPLAVDGKLGPATCGARNRLTVDDKTGAVWSNPSTCQSYSTPKLTSAGCGSGGSSLVTSSPASQASMSSKLPLMSSNTKKALGFVAGGLLAVGAVYFIKKRRG